MSTWTCGVCEVGEGQPHKPGCPYSDQPLDLLEDYDGAPYPEPVQTFWRSLHEQLDRDLHGVLVAALESVAAASWDHGFSACADHEPGNVVPNPHGGWDGAVSRTVPVPER